MPKPGTRGMLCVPCVFFLLPVFVLDKRLTEPIGRGSAHARHRAFLICSVKCREDTEGLVGNQNQIKNMSGGVD